MDDDTDGMMTAVNHMMQECIQELGIPYENHKKFSWDVDYDPCFLNCFYEKHGVVSIPA